MRKKRRICSMGFSSPSTGARIGQPGDSPPVLHGWSNPSATPRYVSHLLITWKTYDLFLLRRLRREFCDELRVHIYAQLCNFFPRRLDSCADSLEDSLPNCWCM